MPRTVPGAFGHDAGDGRKRKRPHGMCRFQVSLEPGLAEQSERRTGILAFHSGCPLPAAEELQESMFRLDGCFRLNLSGAPENAPDHVLEGEYLDEEGESQLDVFWVMETDDARQAFKRDGAALRQIGNRTKMLRFILEDEYALGHVFAMMHAILEHRDGLLVIPDSRGNVILERRKALDFLNREIRES